MAAATLKHTASTDILFPEESSDGLNDSFYSQPSTSNYSTYSQEVKYIFNPKVATRGPSSQGEYSEIENYSNNSNRNSARSNQSEANKHSPGSHGNPPGGAGNYKNGSVVSAKQTNSDTVPSHGPQYGLSIKSVAYPQRHNSTDNVATSQHNSELVRHPQRHHSTDALTSPPRTSLFNYGHSNQNNHSNNRVPPPPPQRSTSSDSPLKPHTPRTSSDSPLKPHTPRIVDANHNHKVPPKPKRLHQINITPDKPKDKQPPGQEIYATPTIANKLAKKNRNGPLPPPPPPYPKPGKLNPAIWDPENFNSRRRTWSPPTFNRIMGHAGSMQLQAMRCYRSNEQLDVVEDSTYEDLDAISNSSAPPKMAHSGQLPKTPHERIIKPIAFKPIITPQNRYTPQRPTPSKSSPPSGAHRAPFSGSHSSPPSGRPIVMSPHHVVPDRADPPSIHGKHSANQSQDDGYMSQDGIHINSGMLHYHNSHQGSVQALDLLDRSAASQSSSQDGHAHHNGFCKMNSDAHSYASSNISQMSSTMGGDVYTMSTPSPSDSGLGEVEVVLRKKDAEIKQLRETMERNESAILQVYEEKRQNWQLELHDHVSEWEKRLRAQQQKSFKTEQALLMQLFKLQQERKSIRLEADGLRAEKEKTEHKCGELTAEMKCTNSKVDELNWELQQKSGEISLLKAQLKDAKEDTTNRSTDLIGARSQVKELVQERDQMNTNLQNMSAELERSQSDFKSVQDKLRTSQTELNEAQQVLVSHKNNVPSGDHVSLLENELEHMRKELSEIKIDYSHEKETWLEEKNKVIRYQKHLQLNYVQVMRKNKMLEDEVEQLTLELENRDIKLMTADGMVLTEEESVC